MKNYRETEKGSGAGQVGRETGRRGGQWKGKSPGESRDGVGSGVQESDPGSKGRGSGEAGSPRQRAERVQVLLLPRPRTGVGSRTESMGRSQAEPSVCPSALQELLRGQRPAHRSPAGLPHNSKMSKRTKRTQNKDTLNYSSYFH